MKRMRTHTKLALCFLATVAGAAFLGYGVAVQLSGQPICPDVAPSVAQTEAIVLPPPPASPQLLPPKRAAKRRIFPSALVPTVEQCAPGPVSSSRIRPADEEVMHYVPEPGSVALAGIGLAALAIARSRNTPSKGA